MLEILVLPYICHASKVTPPLNFPSTSLSWLIIILEWKINVFKKNQQNSLSVDWVLLKVIPAQPVKQVYRHSAYKKSETTVGGSLTVTVSGLKIYLMEAIY